MGDDAATVTKALLFVDVTDSSRLYATYGNTRAHAIVGDCLTFLRGIVAAHRGEVVKALGDELMCAFPDANEAVTAAIEMHQRLREQTSSGSLHASLSLRIGLHEGPVLLDAKDVFGDAVNLAARMASLSKAHQIMTTRATVDRLDGSLRPLARFVDQSTVKGQTGSFDLYEVVWDIEEATQATRKAPIPALDRSTLSLEIEQGGRTWTVDLQHPSLSFGRSAQCDVVIEDTRVSRLHAKLEYVKDRIVLRDMSTNGTYVHLEDGGERHVRRDEMPVSAGGLMSLGRAIDRDSELIVKLILRKDAARL